MEIPILFNIVRPEAACDLAPKRGTPEAAGWDLRNAGVTTVIAPGDRCAFPTGLALAIPSEFYGEVRPRSGLAFNHGIVTMAGVIDPDYRGEVKVLLLNTGNEPLTVEHGDRIAQLLIKPRISASFAEVMFSHELGETGRGAAGFGSTGRD